MALDKDVKRLERLVIFLLEGEEGPANLPSRIKNEFDELVAIWGTTEDREHEN